MELDLRNFSDTELNKLLEFTEKLAEHNQKEGLADFGNPDDLDGAERQAKEFAERRKAGYGGSENKEDADIRTGVRDFLRRRGVFRKEDSGKDTQYLKRTKPNF
jgi:hypothetical protein